MQATFPPPQVSQPRAERRHGRRGRQWLRIIFAGDPRVWRWSALAGIPLFVVMVVWCLVPRPYYTGTDSVNVLGTNPVVAPHTKVCAGGMNIPRGTARISVAIASAQATPPRWRLTVRTPHQTIVTSAVGRPGLVGTVVAIPFPIPRLPGGGQSVPATLCLQSTTGSYAVGGTPTTAAIQPPVTQGGKPTLFRLAVWYLPRAGATRSYLGELGTILRRATLFAPGFVAPWVLGAVVLVLLPIVALLAVRCLALAAAGGGRRLAVWLFVIAFLNAAAWSVITPPFQAPDEVDHFAYVQSLLERGQRPSSYPAATTGRWSSAENAALLGSDMLTDHTAGDTRAPALPADVAAYRHLVAITHARDNDGGGYQTTSSYGPLYYYAVAPGYLVASGGSAFSQLEGVRLMSALIGALAAVFAFLTVREIAPRHAFAAVLAGLVVAFEPMYSFLSGALNNDIGVDAGAAAVVYLLVRLIRRGPSVPVLGVLGLLLGVLPYVKTSAYYLIPLAAVGILGMLWHHRRRLRNVLPATLGGLAAFVVLLAVGYAGARAVSNGLTPAAPAAGAAIVATPTSTGAATGPLNVALHHPLSYLTYLWEIFLPRLPGMHPHFPPTGLPAQTIFIHRGLAAFGWYDVFFPHWVYTVLSVVMLGGLVFGLLALVRERRALAAHWIEAVLLVLFPIVVIASFEAAFYTETNRPVIAEMGRYAFPALVPLAILAVGALYAFGRRRVVAVGSVVFATLLVFCYASQVLTLTSFFS